MKTRQLGVRVPEYVYEEIERTSQEENKSKSQVAIDFLVKGLNATGVDTTIPKKSSIEMSADAANRILETREQIEHLKQKLKTIKDANKISKHPFFKELTENGVLINNKEIKSIPQLFDNLLKQLK